MWFRHENLLHVCLVQVRLGMIDNSIRIRKLMVIKLIFFYLNFLKCLIENVVPTALW